VFVQIKGQVLFKGEIITKNVKIGLVHLKIFSRTILSEPEELIFTLNLSDIM
jgi:hypothetical protein